MRAPSQARLALSRIPSTPTPFPTPSFSPPPPPGPSAILVSRWLSRASVGRAGPTADGRGAVIAVFDSGVDPAAAGLAVTSSGAPKVLDVIDCTGSGDVKMSALPAERISVLANGAVRLVGDRGRVLMTNPAWTNPKNAWRYASKRLFDLMPKRLEKRLKSERRKSFMVCHRAALTAAADALGKHSKSQAPKGEVAHMEWKKWKQELETRLAVLKQIAEAEDPGPLIDCVSWHDGGCWRAAFDTREVQGGQEFWTEMQEQEQQDEARARLAEKGGSQAEPADGQVETASTFAESSLTALQQEVGQALSQGTAPAASGGSDSTTSPSTKGLLEDCSPMTDFSAERQWSHFGDKDSCTFCANFYDDGDILSIVTDCSPHGTHVAGIAASFHPDQPELNGVAPGAQIVSCKIGDSRLGSMETGTGLARALAAVIRHKVDVINMSYGEPVHEVNAGRFVSLAEEVVWKHNIAFISSAGNSGPALTTVGAPGGSSTAILGIGAYVSPSMAAAAHSIREPPAEGLQYTWSSRGPCTDGAIGVAFSAPGGAIAPVPTWTREGRTLMNGTSMASPNACGAWAILVSCLKARGVSPIPPEVIRRACENTAVPIGDTSDSVLTSGRGLLQVDKALEYLERILELGIPNAWYSVEVCGTGNQRLQKGRGIYMRGEFGPEPTKEFRCTIIPQVHEDAGVLDARVTIEDHVALKSSASWVSCPEQILVTHGGRGFNILVDTEGLEVGLHYEEVHGYDMRHEWRGPLFRVPVTVVVPQTMPAGISEISFESSAFTPGRIERHFVQTPEGASWAELTLTCEGPVTNPKIFMIRASQVAPQKHHKEMEFRSTVTMDEHAVQKMTFSVQDHTCLEIVVSQFWLSLGTCSVASKIVFHGISARGADKGVHVDGCVGHSRIDVEARHRPEKLLPSASLTHLSVGLRPHKAHLEPEKDPRDALPDGRMTCKLLLEYKFSLSEAAKVKPVLPTNDSIYDSQLEGQLCMVADTHKRLLSWSDAYPEQVSLQKGSYVIMVCFRHDDISVLGKFKQQVLLLQHSIESIPVPVHRTLSAALLKRNSMKDALVLGPGITVPLFIGPLSKQLPALAVPGTTLTGKLSLSKDSPVKIELSYSVPPLPNKAEEKSLAGTEDVKSTDDLAKKLVEDVRDSKISCFEKLKVECEESSNTFDAFAEILQSEYPGHVPLLKAVLKGLVASKANVRSHLNQDIVSAAQKIVETIDIENLATYFARKTALDGELKKEKKDKSDEKAALLDALENKCIALLKLIKAADGEEARGVLQKEFRDTYTGLARWSVTSSEFPLIHAEKEAMEGRLGCAIKILSGALSKGKKDEKIYSKREALYRSLGWGHAVLLEKSLRCLHFPPGGYPPPF